MESDRVVDTRDITLAYLQVKTLGDPLGDVKASTQVYRPVEMVREAISASLRHTQVYV